MDLVILVVFLTGEARKIMLEGEGVGGERELTTGVEVGVEVIGRDVHVVLDGDEEIVLVWSREGGRGKRSEGGRGGLIWSAII